MSPRDAPNPAATSAPAQARATALPASSLAAGAAAAPAPPPASPPPPPASPTPPAASISAAVPAPSSARLGARIGAQLGSLLSARLSSAASSRSCNSHAGRQDVDWTVAELVRASALGDTSKVEQLLKSGVDPNRCLKKKALDSSRPHWTGFAGEGADLEAAAKAARAGSPAARAGGGDGDGGSSDRVAGADVAETADAADEATDQLGALPEFSRQAKWPPPSAGVDANVASGERSSRRFSARMRALPGWLSSFVSLKSGFIPEEESAAVSSPPAEPAVGSELARSAALRPLQRRHSAARLLQRRLLRAALIAVIERGTADDVANAGP
jgi:hypothetical protein